MSDRDPMSEIPEVPAEQSISAYPAAPIGSDANDIPSTHLVMPKENVALGLVASLGGVALGVILTVVAANFGFIASLVGLAMAVVSVRLYQMGAGAPPRVGAIPLVLVILFGVVLCFFAVVAWDASKFYDDTFAGASDAPSKFEFIRQVAFDPEVLKGYTRDFVMLAIFTGLGIFSTLRSVLTSRG